MTDILDLHTHTIASGHAYNTLYEMVQAAADQGLSLVGSTDHTPAMPGTAHEYYFLNFKVIPRHLFGIHLLMGAELNILGPDGSVDLPEYLLKRLDYAIASIHEPCYPRDCSVSDNTNAYLNVMKNPYVTIIGHPDDGRFPVDYDTLAAAAKEHHKLLEVNNSSLNPLSVRKGARENYLTLLEYCKKYRTPIVIDSDAHCAAEIGKHHLAHSLLEEMQFPEELIVNTSLERLFPYIPKLAEYVAQGDGSSC
ncbi:MAG: phosphatase [Lachnospiraceae bacterium]